jgi:hypothetical protein
VDWNDANETQQAISLMKAWNPIDPADSLELLSSSFTNAEVGERKREREREKRETEREKRETKRDKERERECV